MPLGFASLHCLAALKLYLACDLFDLIEVPVTSDCFSVYQSFYLILSLRNSSYVFIYQVLHLLTLCSCLFSPH